MKVGELKKKLDKCDPTSGILVEKEGTSVLHIDSGQHSDFDYYPVLEVIEVNNSVVLKLGRPIG
jgi:hypothetical protein